MAKLVEQLAKCVARLAKLLAKLVNPSGPFKTDLLVLQGTPFCNIACTYCYLPQRSNPARMSHEIVEAAVRWVFSQGLARDRLSIAWHAGEPLVLEPRWYEAAFRRVRAGALCDAKITHSIQTNGILINDQWCDFFEQNAVSIGVSLDGPAEIHDLHRRTRAGGGTHAQTMRGVAALQRRSIPFHVIAVVTSSTLDAPDRFLDFFEAEGIDSLGLNIEEIEGCNRKSSLDDDHQRARFQKFIESVVDRVVTRGTPKLREVEKFVNALGDPLFGKRKSNDQNTPFGIVTVAYDGTIFTFSPELAGQTDPRFGSFELGNIASTTLEDIVSGPHYRRIAREIGEGGEACARGCSYFRLCLGGAPSNKLAETGRFDTTETMACRLGVMELSEAVLQRLEQDLTSQNT